MWQPLKERILRRLALRENITTGSRFHVGPRSVLWAPRGLRIGDDVYIGKNVTIEVDGEIGDGVLIANNVGIVGRQDHDIRECGASIRRAAWVGEEPERLSRATYVGSDVWIGFGAVVLSGVRIGDSAIVAAGAVVREDVAPNQIVSGNPASPIAERFAPEVLGSHWQALKASGVRIRHDEGRPS